MKRQRAVEHLRSNTETIAQEISEVATRDVDEAVIHDANELAKDYIDTLIETIERSDPTPEHGGPPKPDIKHPENLKRPSDKINQTIKRRNIKGDSDATVVVVPANIERGLDFLFRNNAWGFVHIGQNPDFIAFYITGGDGVSAVWYVARVSDVVAIEDADLVDDPEEIIDLSDPNEQRKKVIELESNSLFELEDPIPYAKEYPQNLRYTSLEKLRAAETTAELF